MGAEAFKAARDFLFDNRTNYPAAHADFRWPKLDNFNYALDWFDNMGAVVRYNGDFGADGALALVGEYAFKGQKVKERLSIKKQDDGQLLFKNEVGVGDAPLQLVGESLAAPKK